MASLKEIIDQLGKQAKDTNKIASKILKIKGLKRLVIQLNAVPNGNSIRYSMTIHSANNFRKQIGITADDAEDFKIIGEFLEKYRDLLNEYVKFTRRNNGVVQEEELDLEENDNQQSKKSQRKNIEDEF